MLRMPRSDEDTSAAVLSNMGLILSAPSVVGRIGTELGDSLKRHCGMLTRASRRTSEFLGPRGAAAVRVPELIQESGNLRQELRELLKQCPEPPSCREAFPQRSAVSCARSGTLGRLSDYPSFGCREFRRIVMSRLRAAQKACEPQLQTAGTLPLRKGAPAIHLAIGSVWDPKRVKPRPKQSI